jgi:hypothetical protein
MLIFHLQSGVFLPNVRLQFLLKIVAVGVIPGNIWNSDFNVIPMDLVIFLISAPSRARQCQCHTYNIDKDLQDFVLFF